MSVTRPHRRLDREAPLLLGDVLLEDVGLDRAPEPLRGDPLLLGGDDVEGEQDRRRGVDRHRDGDLVERDPVEQRLHVVDRVEGDALDPDLAQRAPVVGVEAHQGRHVEGGREPVLAVLEQVAEARVGLLDRAEARELAHRPQPPPIHRRVDAAGERVLARVTELRRRVEALQVLLGVQRLDRVPGEGLEERRRARGCARRAPPATGARADAPRARSPWTGGYRRRVVRLAGDDRRAGATRWTRSSATISPPPSPTRRRRRGS